MDRDSILKNLRVAKPCPSAWSEMKGDDKSRVCEKCQLTVYDLSSMGDEEVESLAVKSGSERDCVKLFKRVDGKVMTRDCPLGIKILSKPMAIVLAAGTVLAGLLILYVLVAAFDEGKGALNRSISTAFKDLEDRECRPLRGPRSPQE